MLDIIEAAEKRGITCFGVRAHNCNVSIGDGLGASYNTVDDQSPVPLAGICCISLEYDGFEVSNLDRDLAALKQYKRGGSVVLVGGQFVDYGNDPNEIIIGNAEVLYVF
jgi:hypothetical protein